MSQKMSLNGNVPWTSGQRDELLSSFFKNLPKLEENVSFDLANHLIQKPLSYQRKIREIFFPGENGLVKNVEGVYPEDLLEFHEGWVEFYKCFGINIDLKDYPLPDLNRIKLAKHTKYWSILWPRELHYPLLIVNDILKKVINEVQIDFEAVKVMDVYPQIKVALIPARMNAAPNYDKFSTQEPRFYSFNAIRQSGIFGTTFSQGCLISARLAKDFSDYLDIGECPEPLSRYIPGDKSHVKYPSYTIHTGSVLPHEGNFNGYIVTYCGWGKKRFRAYSSLGCYESRYGMAVREQQF